MGLAMTDAELNALKQKGSRRRAEREGTVLAKRGHFEVALLGCGLLESREWCDYGPVQIHTGYPSEWTLWRHEIGFVLCLGLSPSGYKYEFEGSPDRFIGLGVQDCRDRHRDVIDLFVHLVQTEGATLRAKAVVPFIVADDPYDGYEALAAAKAYFHFSPAVDQELRFKLRSTEIPDWHEHRLEHLGDGSFDVALGLSRWCPHEIGHNHEQWINAVGKYQRDTWGARCVVITNAEGLGRMEQGEISFSFGGLLDSAVDRVYRWGYTVAVLCSWDSWFALVGSDYRLLNNAFQLVHIPASHQIEAVFFQVLKSEFQLLCGGGGENGGISETELTYGVADAIWKAAGCRKGRSLAMLRTLVVDCERRGLRGADISDVARLVTAGDQVGGST